VTPISVRSLLSLRDCSVRVDPFLVAMSIFCPCVQTAMNKADIDGRECNVCDVMCSYLVAYGQGNVLGCPVDLEYFTRQQIRSRYNMRMDACSDCCSTCVLYWCTSCQNAREIALRKQGEIRVVVLPGGSMPAIPGVPEQQVMSQ